MNLINKKLLAQKINEFEFPTGQKSIDAKAFIKSWQNALKDRGLEQTKEKSVQGRFLVTFFDRILGYTDITGEKEEWTLIQHPRIENDNKEPDGSLGYFTRDKKITKAVIELKDAQTNLEKRQNRGLEKLTPIEQGYLYANKYGGCNWIIVSNYKEIRIYNKNRSQEYYEKFDIFTLDTDFEFKKFYYLLCQENFLTHDKFNVLDLLTEDSNEAEKDITKQFYSEYQKIRLELLDHLVENNPTYNKILLLEKTQKLLDRFIFTLFCEDTSSLLPLNIVKNTYQSAINSLRPTDDRVWSEFKGLFLAIDKGNHRVTPPINAYNGGLFAYDEILDNLIIKDSAWDKLINMAEYDFETELNVNILGHIFEQSISDLEQIRFEIIEILENTSDNSLVEIPKELVRTREKKGRRKKDGIFYTPEYITSFIVENTVGKYLEENPESLESIKILDPACGSGAFLNQAHSFLLKEYKDRYEAKLVEKQKKGDDILSFEDRNVADENKHILLNNIYGVDLNQESVEITKLALWLKTARKTEPLQNLDKNVKCGNSLVDDPKIAGEKAFKWKDEFGTILDDGGFDVIIGNPPYIKEYTNKSAFNGLRDKKYYQGKMDLWTYFGCLSIDLLKEGGYISFIAPSNWTTNSGASIFRNKILQEGEIITFIDFNDFKVFEGVGINTMIFVFRKGKPREKYEVNFMKLKNQKYDPIVVSQALGTNLASTDIIQYNSIIEPAKSINKMISFSNLEASQILNKINNKDNSHLSSDDITTGIDVHQDFVNNSHLEVLSNVSLGDGIFVISDKEKQEMNFTDSELSLIKPFYTTKEIDRYYANPDNKYWIIYTKSDINNLIDSYPNIKQHLDKFTSIITTDNKPYGLHRARKEDFFKGDKIISARKCAQPSFSYTDFDSYVSQTFIVIKTKRYNLKYLTALFNSKLVQYWLKNKGKLQGKLYQIDAEPLLSIPIHNITNESEEILLPHIDSLILLKKQEIELLNESDDFITSHIFHRQLNFTNRVLSLGWNQVMDLIEKQKVQLRIEEKEELFNWFRDRQKKLGELNQKIKHEENIIDQSIYKIYGLNQTEINIIEDNLI